METINDKDEIKLPMISKQLYLKEEEILVITRVARENRISFSEQVRRILDKFISSAHITNEEY